MLLIFVVFLFSFSGKFLLPADVLWNEQSECQSPDTDNLSASQTKVLKITNRLFFFLTLLDMRPEKSDFSKAIDLWTEWNGKINVVSRKDIDNIFEHHILHSLAIAEYLERSCDAGLDGTKVLDLGTGGGFPGIPLAIACPEAEFTLCDSIAKKIRVAEAVAGGLGLTNVKCVNARAESLPEVFDWVVSRAVTSLDNFYPWVKGKYSKGILYLKGGDVNEEIAVLCGKFRIDPGKITVWPISDWLEDEYYKEKFVIHIRK